MTTKNILKKKLIIIKKKSSLKNMTYKNKFKKMWLRNIYFSKTWKNNKNNNLPCAASSPGIDSMCV